MNTVEKIESWGDKHHPKWLDLLRILLGIILLAKGYSFMANTDALKATIDNSRFGEVSFWLAHYVIFAHLIGGLLIAVGLMTRLSILFQLPVLIGAIVFVNAEHGLFSAYSTEFWLSMLIFFLLCFFLVEGSGPWSIDEYMLKHPEKNDWEKQLPTDLPAEPES